MKYLPLLCAALLSSPSFAQTNQHAMEHGTMDHSKMNQSTETTPPRLSEAGNDAFGTIQEVIVQLNNDPNTDWSKVNIEALRLHLLDMADMTVNVAVLSQKPVEHGMVAVVKPTTIRAKAALERVFSAHPAQLEKETGWKMTVTKTGEQYTITTLTSKPEEVNKIRGLGYVGLMANGNHHQPHHWMMATGANPHAHNH